MTPGDQVALQDLRPAAAQPAPDMDVLAGALLEALVRRRDSQAAAAPPALIVAQAADRFEAWARQTYTKRGKPGAEVECLVRPMAVLRELFGSLPAHEFNVAQLRQVRERLVATKARPRRVGEKAEKVPCLARKTVNDHVSRVLRMFKWLAAEGMVPAEVAQRLTVLAGLRRGRSAARETPRIMPIEWSQVEPVLPHLRGEPRAIVELLWWTGARPTEICTMRLADLDRTGPVWLYRVRDDWNKCAHRDQDRTVPLGPRAQAVLAAFLEQVPQPDPEAYLFSPEGLVVRNYAARREARQSKRWPSHSSARRRARRGSGRQHFHPCYDAQSLRKAVARACDRAGVKPWGPNRIRHTVATRLARLGDLQAVSTVLGHRQVSTTEIYAERDVQRACALMAVHG